MRILFLFLIMSLVVSCIFDNQPNYKVDECSSLQLTIDSLIHEKNSIILKFNLKNITSNQVNLKKELFLHLSTTTSCSGFRSPDHIRVINDSIVIRPKAIRHYTTKIIEEPNKPHNLDCLYRLFSFLNVENTDTKCYIISEPKKIEN